MPVIGGFLCILQISFISDLRNILPSTSFSQVHQSNLAVQTVVDNGVHRTKQTLLCQWPFLYSKCQRKWVPFLRKLLNAWVLLFMDELALLLSWKSLVQRNKRQCNILFKKYTRSDFVASTKKKLIQPQQTGIFVVTVSIIFTININCNSNCRRKK